MNSRGKDSPGGTDSLFEAAILPHLDSAYNLARWLTRNDQDAQDVAQEALLRAFRAFDTFRGGDARAWLLAVVGNTCFSWLRKNRQSMQTLDDQPDVAAEPAAFDPGAIAMRTSDAAAVRGAIEQLSVPLREAVVLCDMEGMSYKQIAAIAGVPIGTVMSRLSLARRQLHDLLASSQETEP